MQKRDNNRVNTDPTLRALVNNCFWSSRSPVCFHVRFQHVPLPQQGQDGCSQGHAGEQASSQIIAQFEAYGRVARAVQRLGIDLADHGRRSHTHLAPNLLQRTGLRIQTAMAQLQDAHFAHAILSALIANARAADFIYGGFIRRSNSV